jgi:hypothetical protein
MGLVGVETPSATRVGGATSAANLLAEGDRPGPVGMNTPSIPAEELSGGGEVDAQAILNYASSNAGKSVGKKGQCFELVDAALRKAGAKSAADYGEVREDIWYTWGSEVQLGSVKPGDVIQFEDYAAEVETDTPKDTSTKLHERPHHSAIVKSVGADGKITVWEQNAPKAGAPVSTYDLYFKDTSWKEGENTITVKVTGKFKFYRPQKR